MAQRFTYDEFQRELTNSGLGSEFSSADLQLAQQNPDAGMSILKYKRAYHNAPTPEQRALANLGAEGIRSSYGNYTGGGAGSQFYLDPLSPNSFQQDAKPTYSSNRTGLVDDLLNKQLNYGNYSYDVAQPEYTNRYDETIQDLLKQILNREAFSYDPERDQLYSQYRKQYTREGDRAQQNAIGAAAAASGGIPSSYAATAAAQAPVPQAGVSPTPRSHTRIFRRFWPSGSTASRLRQAVLAISAAASARGNPATSRQNSTPWGLPPGSRVRVCSCQRMGLPERGEGRPIAAVTAFCGARCSTRSPAAVRMRSGS